jgi:malonyl-CoA O-methyltransferase
MSTPLPLPLHEAYDRWAEVYPPEPHNPLMRAEQAAMLALLPSVANHTVLDLACGSGRYAELMEAAGAAPVVGLDYSAAMLMRSRMAARVRGDMSRLPLRSGAFHLVISGLALGHASNLAACVAEVARVLRPGGVLLYSDFHADASRAGLTRSFKDALGRSITLPRDGYAPEEHRDALLGAGFAVESQRELRVGVEINEPFSNSAEFYRRHHHLPLVLVMRARKP